MKENVLDVLLYLFQNYMDGEIEIEPDRETLEEELLEAGFPPAEINKAFEWLDGLAENQGNQEDTRQGARSFRYYTDEECSKLDRECRGFLMYLENTGVVNCRTRELIIERVMALDSSEIDIDRLKWVILMVLFNQPEQDGNYEWIENMVFDSTVDSLH